MSSWSPSTSASGWKDYIPAGVSNAVASGVGSLASGVVGAVSSSVPREPSALSSWVPTSVKAYLPNGDIGRGSDLDRDQVVSLQFDADNGSPAQPHFLSVCFRNGFQLWEVLDAAEDASQGTRETQPLREVLSVRQGHTRMLTVLPSLKVPEGSVLHGHQPCLAVVAGEEVGDMNVVRIFSMKSNDFVHQLRFHGDVHGIVCNRNWMVVVLKNQLMVHDLVNLEPIQTFNTFPSPTHNGVIALGPRWLAYPSNQPLRQDGSLAPTTTFGSPSFDVAVGVAGTVATGAKQLGEMGIRTLNSYLNNSPPLAPPSEPAVEFAGSVIVRDVENTKIFHHFKAHDNPVSLMKYDPSGLLLATASMDGHNVNVFEMDPHSGKMLPKHLYKLVRGLTSTQIRDIAFSVDTRWMAVTSSRGTSHVYPINPDGSQPSVDTHVPSNTMDVAWPMYPVCASYAPLQNPPTTVFAVNRVRTDGGGRASSADAAAACARFAVSPGVPSGFTQFRPSSEALFLVSGEGSLARYNMRPSSKVDPDSQRETLQLETECQGTFDICRRQSWHEVRCPPERIHNWSRDPARGNSGQAPGCMPEWVSNVEIYTHERREQSVWGSRRFQFKTFSSERLQHVKDKQKTHALENIPCDLIGVGISPEADSGNDEDDLEGYFVIETNPRRSLVPPQPAALSSAATTQKVTKVRVPHSTPGVYGGLPSSLESSPVDAPFLEARAGLVICSASKSATQSEVPATFGRSRSKEINIVSSSADYNAIVGDDQALEDLDGWESNDPAESNIDRSSDSDGADNKDKQEDRTSPGLAASSMMIFDQDLEFDEGQTATASKGKQDWSSEESSKESSVDQVQAISTVSRIVLEDEEEFQFRPASKRNSSLCSNANEKVRENKKELEVKKDLKAKDKEDKKKDVLDSNSDDWDDDWDSHNQSVKEKSKQNHALEKEILENKALNEADEAYAEDDALVFGSPSDANCLATSPEDNQKEITEDSNGGKSKKKKEKKKKGKSKW